MKNIMEKTDTKIKTDVLAELEYEPSVKVTDIGVLVKNGVVTLNGYATSYAEKLGAVRVAKRIAGVKAITDDIEVNLLDSQGHSDEDITAAAANQIKCSPAIPAGTARVTVRGGWITVEGDEDWWYQKQAVDDAVRNLAGVKGVTNLITIKPNLMPTDIKMSIRSALERNALVDASNVQVETAGNKVVLRGTVENYIAREEAERAAWNASGVFSVDNQLKVEWSSGFVE